MNKEPELCAAQSTILYRQARHSRPQRLGAAPQSNHDQQETKKNNNKKLALQM